MAIGTITRGNQAGKSASAPTFVDKISFTGDAAYATGGTADFEDSFQAIVGDNREIVDIIPDDCGGYLPVYDRTNDKLKVYGGSVQETAAWTAELTVTTHVLVMADAGHIISVDGTTGSGTGAKQIQYAGSPAQGYVQVEYTAGVATLTFNATDAITGARVVYLPTTSTVPVAEVAAAANLGSTTFNLTVISK